MVHREVASSRPLDVMREIVGLMGPKNHPTDSLLCMGMALVHGQSIMLVCHVCTTRPLMPMRSMF